MQYSFIFVSILGIFHAEISIFPKFFCKIKKIKTEDKNFSDPQNKTVFVFDLFLFLLLLIYIYIHIYCEKTIIAVFFTMTRTKPLSIEEKVSRIEEMLREKKSFFTMKEIEKICLKEKGVVPQSLKEVIDILVTEGRIKEEKIGISKYYWCFASDERVKKSNKVASLEKELSTLEKKHSSLEKSISMQQEEKIPSEKRTKDLLLLQEHKKTLASLNELLEIEKENDPEQMAELEKELLNIKNEIQKWTENVILLRSYLLSFIPLTSAQFDEYFHIPADFEDGMS